MRPGSTWRATVLATLLWACGAATAQDGARPVVGVSWMARVSYVVDGDSIWVRPEGGGARVKLRIDGIDAPEICQNHGPQARDALRALAQNQRVRVTVWAHDRWGRAIASVVRAADDLNLAERMVAEGWAWTDSHGWRQGKYWRAEAEARAAARGLFTDAAAERPADFRARHGPCSAPPG
ncbi:thermonuclease family protein [Ottowia testudinis]|uniref:Thermonuclease family protein n=1 Tax=Ottowia testudinis TaxID=2816950 RepID=A0A975CCQ9_9BURK|nr:thermonuclease family protein [Ottowia testudinis]QTD43985.1 thermonuclease family protein [Ottowia testudinis]